MSLKPETLRTLPDWPALLPIEAAALYLGGVSPATVRKYEKETRGFPQRITILGREMFRRVELDDFIARYGADGLQSQGSKRFGA